MIFPRPASDGRSYPGSLSATPVHNLKIDERRSKCKMLMKIDRNDEKSCRIVLKSAFEVSKMYLGLLHQSNDSLLVVVAAHGRSVDCGTNVRPCGLNTKLKI